MLEREFFTLLDNSVKRTVKLFYRIDLSGVKLIYIDGTSFKKDHNYVIVVCDQDRLIIFIYERKSLEMVDRIAVWLEVHNRKRDNIWFISCNLGEAYPFGVRRNFSNAKIVYDEFHSVRLIVDVIDDTAHQAVKN